MRQKFHINFTGHSKIFFGISLGIMLVCLILNITLLPTQLDIQFTGGAIMNYSYTGDLSEDEIASVAQKATKENVSFQFSKNIAATDGAENVLSIELTEAKKIAPEDEATITYALQEAFPKNNFTNTQTTSVDPSKGATFFLKCMVAVLIAAVLLILYVGVRFRKIGGISAGCTAVIAIVHDVIMVYFCFVLFRMPLDDNFIAVVLTILGYSINSTIVVYDRIRENRRLAGPRANISEVVNNSINQTLARTICTSITTLLALGSVLAVALIFNISTVVSFALPMMCGVIFGCYSSVCISSPLWVIWTNHKQKVKAAKAEEQKKSKATNDTKNETASQESSNTQAPAKQQSKNNNNNKNSKKKKKK